jgi:acetyl-CoA acetyltransferase
MNPEAVMYGRGPFSAEDVLASPLIADPFHLLDLCLANDGAAAFVVTKLDRARDHVAVPVEVLGMGSEWYKQQYVDPPRFEEVGYIGEAACRRALATAGVKADEIDLFEFYDPNSFEIARQVEILGLAEHGQGFEFLRERGMFGPDGMAANTDGGLLSFSHIGRSAPTLKIVEAVRQLRGTAAVQRAGALETAFCSGAGSGAQYYNAAVLGLPRV